MGRKFLIPSLLLAYGAVGLAQAGKILLPEPPESRPPPSRGSKAHDQDIQRKREALNEESGKDRIQEKETLKPSFERDKELLEQMLKPAPLRYGFNISLLYPFIQTSGSERKSYQLDPSAGFNFLYRIGKEEEPSGWNVWTGFRGNYFQGTGVYKKKPGSFSFLYFGPMIGVGIFSPGVKSLGADAFNDHESVKDHLSARHGFVAMTGIAGQSREAVAESEYGEAEEDFKSQAVDFDTPGLWAEIWYINLHYNALSFNFLAGMQLGQGKSFYYGGIGVGGWL